MSTRTCLKTPTRYPFPVHTVLGDIALPGKGKKDELERRIDALKARNKLDPHFDLADFPLSLSACTRRLIVCTCKRYMDGEYFRRVVSTHPSLQLALIDDMFGIWATETSSSSIINSVGSMYDLAFLGSRRNIHGDICTPYFGMPASEFRVGLQPFNDKMDTNLAVVLVQG